MIVHTVHTMYNVYNVREGKKESLVKIPTTTSYGSKNDIYIPIY